MLNCKHNYVYLIDARNANVGIYDEEQKGFVISRHKFKSNFLFVEYHWDTGEPFGTVKPLKELFEYDGGVTDKEKLDYLNDLIGTYDD